MKKRLRLTAIMALIALLLFVYINIFEVDKPLKQGEEKPVKLLALSPEEVTSISFYKEGLLSWQIEKRDDGSFLNYPYEARADEDEVEGFLKHVSSLHSEDVVKLPENLTLYGLSDKSPRLVFKAGNKTESLDLGQKLEISNSYYVKIGGDKNVYSVPSYVFGSFHKTAENMRDRHLFQGNFANIEKIQYSNKELKLELQKTPNSFDWNIVAPKCKADSITVAGLINNVNTIKASSFIEMEEGDTLSDLLLDPPLVKVSIFDASGKEYTLSLGQTVENETFSKTNLSDEVTMVRANEAEALTLSLYDLRDKTLILPDAKKITNITLTNASATVVLQQKDGVWKKGTATLPEKSFSDFWEIMEETPIIEFFDKLPSGDFGLKGDKVMTANFEVSGKKYNFSLGAETEKGIYLLLDSKLYLIGKDVKIAFDILMDELNQI
ncbi:MAG: DUF4340 domain-containing protein [Candidatus Riflebacteria bacterium]|nr:DUF4340 domain-containing protein [Candidatus Riflebacteria bacterium]